MFGFIILTNSIRFCMIESMIAIILLLCGMIFTVKFKFYSPIVIWRALRAPFRQHKSNKNEVSPFSGLCTALGGCIGTGNIIGVTSCIMIGGIGSVFWIWVCAFLSLATKYAEVYFSVIARDKKGGSPMQYIPTLLGKPYIPLAVTWCILCLLSAICTGSTVQSNAISEAVVSLLPKTSPFTKARFICGIVIAITTFFMLVGGLRRVSKSATALVPIMCIIYVGACLICIIASGKSITDMVSEIVRDAFMPSKIVSGSIAFSILRTMRLGVSIGIFSNEAGMGTSTLAHSATSSNDPHAQGGMGMWEIVIDTFVICTITAFLVIACVPHNVLSDTSLSPLYIIMSALSTFFGGSTSSYILSACTILFAFTSILGWSFYGQVCCDFLFGSSSKLFSFLYKFVFCVMLVCGCMFPLGILWSIASTFNMVLALPNIIALVIIVKKKRLQKK